MSIRTVANVILSPTTLAAITPNTLNYVALDGSNTTFNSGVTSPTNIVTPIPLPFVGVGAYYNQLRFNLIAGAQTASVGMVLDIFAVYPPGTVVPAGFPLSVNVAPSLGRTALSAAATTTAIVDLVNGGPIASQVKDNLVYPHFIVTLFATTAPTAGQALSLLIQGICNPGPALVG